MPGKYFEIFSIHLSLILLVSSYLISADSSTTDRASLNNLQSKKLEWLFLVFFCLFYVFLSSLLLAIFLPREFIWHIILHFFVVFRLLFPFVMSIFLYILFCYYIFCFVSCCALSFLSDVLDVCC